MKLCIFFYEREEDVSICGKQAIKFCGRQFADGMMQDQSVTSIVYMDADDAGDVKSAEKVSYICCGHTQTQI